MFVNYHDALAKETMKIKLAEDRGFLVLIIWDDENVEDAVQRVIKKIGEKILYAV